MDGAAWVAGLSLWAACAAFAAAVVTDLRHRVVPNAIPLILLALFALLVLTGEAPTPGSWWAHVAIGAAFLLAGFGLYLTGKFGAGDAKLMAAAGLWVGPAELSTFLFSLAAGAFALSLVALLPFATTRRWRTELPFAVAIVPAVAAVLVPRTLAHGYP